MWIWFVLTFIIGVVVGIVFMTIFWCARTTSGTFKVDDSVPELHTCNIRIDYPFELYKAKRLILRADSKSDQSQK